MLERRRSTRSRVLKTAKLVLGTSSVIDCVVHNLTSVGARIQIPSATDLPQKLNMTFDVVARCGRAELCGGR
jgi:hypothetical protein